MGYYTKIPKGKKKELINESYPPYLIIPFDGKEYDQYGNWIREYGNLRVPFSKLAMPRNEEERIAWRHRAAMQLCEHTKNMPISESFYEEDDIYSN